MKRGIILLITVLGLTILTGCNSSDTSKENNSNKQQEVSSNYSNDNFDKLNIVSSEIEKEDRESYDEEIITTFKVTNNGYLQIKYLSLDFAYYDSEGTCISTEGRFHDAVIQPGKSAFIDTYSDVEGEKDLVAEVKITGYDYELTEENSLGLSEVYINLETKEVE